MSVALRKSVQTQGSNTPPQIDIKDEKFNKESAVSINETSSELGFAVEERRFFFQRRSKYDPNAIATLVRSLSVVLAVQC